MRVIYVAGPYRASGMNGVLDNIMLARSFARQLWLKGWAVICPHANTFMMDGPDLPSMAFLDGDMEMVSRCDAVFMLPGWEYSEGAIMEENTARVHGLAVYHNMQEVPDECKPQGYLN